MSGSAASELEYLSRALKAPRIKAVSGRLAGRARDESWDYDAYLAAVLAEEVNDAPRHAPAPRRSTSRLVRDPFARAERAGSM